MGIRIDAGRDHFPDARRNDDSFGHTLYDLRSPRYLLPLHAQSACSCSERIVWRRKHSPQVGEIMEERGTTSSHGRRVSHKNTSRDSNQLLKGYTPWPCITGRPQISGCSISWPKPQHRGDSQRVQRYWLVSLSHLSQTLPNCALGGVGAMFSGIPMTIEAIMTGIVRESWQRHIDTRQMEMIPGMSRSYRIANSSSKSDYHMTERKSAGDRTKKSRSF